MSACTVVYSGRSGSRHRPSPGRRVLPCGEPGRRQPPLVVRQHAAGPGCLAQERDEDRGLCPRASARRWNPLSHAAATNTAAVCATPHGRPVCRTRFPASQRGFPCFAALPAGLPVFRRSPCGASRVSPLSLRGCFAALPAGLPVFRRSPCAPRYGANSRAAVRIPAPARNSPFRGATARTGSGSRSAPAAPAPPRRVRRFRPRAARCTR